MSNNSANSQQPQKLPAAQSVSAWNRLTPDKQQRAVDIAHQFNPQDLTVVSTFGMQLQANLNKVTDPILQKIKVSESGLAGQLLEQLERETSKLEPRYLKPASFQFPLLKTLFNASKHFMNQYEKISSKLEELKKSLDEEGRKLVNDIKALDGLYQENEKYYQELLIFIAAGEIKLAELQGELTALQNSAKSSSNDLFDRNSIVALNDIIDRLRRRIYDLQLLTNSSQQSAAQIRYIQNNDQILVELIQRDILTVIPTWKLHMTTAVMVYRQQQILEKQRAISNANNRLLESSAALLQKGASELAIEAERGVIDFETLQNTHRMLVDTVKETRRIYEEGRQKRIASEKQLEGMRNELRDTLSQLPPP